MAFTVTVGNSTQYRCQYGDDDAGCPQHPAPVFLGLNRIIHHGRCKIGAEDEGQQEGCIGLARPVVEHPSKHLAVHACHLCISTPVQPKTIVIGIVHSDIQSCNPQHQNIDILQAEYRMDHVLDRNTDRFRA